MSPFCKEMMNVFVYAIRGYTSPHARGLNLGIDWVDRDNNPNYVEEKKKKKTEERRVGHFDSNSIVSTI